jgi:hypothetical protein
MPGLCSPIAGALRVRVKKRGGKRHIMRAAPSIRGTVC